jgi:hypothetical protein
MMDYLQSPLQVSRVSSDKMLAKILLCLGFCFQPVSGSIIPIECIFFNFKGLFHIKRLMQEDVNAIKL